MDQSERCLTVLLNIQANFDGSLRFDLYDGRWSGEAFYMDLSILRKLFTKTIQVKL